MKSSRALRARGDSPAETFRDEEWPVGVFVDRAASTPLSSAGDIHSITGISGLAFPAEHDDDGLARRFDKTVWSYSQAQVVVPLTIRDPVPVSSRDRVSLASTLHQHLLMTELPTDPPTTIGGFEEIEALGSLDCVSLVIGRSLVEVSVVKVPTQTETDRGYVVPDGFP